MALKNIFLGLIILALIGCNPTNTPITNEVTIVGEMKNVMWKGELEGKINLDTIAHKTNLYGLGPVEYLTGEIIIFDGKSYKATVLTDSTMQVEETFDIQAPFFGYAHIDKWKENILPDSIITKQQLEKYLDHLAQKDQKPFIFKLSGTIETAKIHLVNLPNGTKVSSPTDAHQGQINYGLSSQLVDIVGFYSTQHKGIFTHHDTNLHMHLITQERQKMGHLDEVAFSKGKMKLFLSVE